MMNILTLIIKKILGEVQLKFMYIFLKIDLLKSYQDLVAVLVKKGGLVFDLSPNKFLSQNSLQVLE